MGYDDRYAVMIVVGCSGADGDYEVDDAMMMMIFVISLMMPW